MNKFLFLLNPSCPSLLDGCPCSLRYNFLFLNDGLVRSLRAFVRKLKSLRPDRKSQMLSSNQVVTDVPVVAELTVSVVVALHPVPQRPLHLKLYHAIKEV